MMKLESSDLLKVKIYEKRISVEPSG